MRNFRGLHMHTAVVLSLLLLPLGLSATIRPTRTSGESVNGTDTLYILFDDVTLIRQVAFPSGVFEEFYDCLCSTRRNDCDFFYTFDGRSRDMSNYYFTVTEVRAYYVRVGSVASQDQTIQCNPPPFDGSNKFSCRWTGLSIETCRAVSSFNGDACSSCINICWLAHLVSYEKTDRSKPERGQCGATTAAPLGSSETTQVPDPTTISTTNEVTTSTETESEAGIGDENGDLGKVIGVGSGCIIIIALIVVLIFFLYRRRKRRRDNEKGENDFAEDEKECRTHNTIATVSRDKSKNKPPPLQFTVESEGRVDDYEFAEGINESNDEDPHEESDGKTKGDNIYNTLNNGLKRSGTEVLGNGFETYNKASTEFKLGQREQEGKPNHVIIRLNGRAEMPVKGVGECVLETFKVAAGKFELTSKNQTGKAISRYPGKRGDMYTLVVKNDRVASGREVEGSGHGIVDTGHLVDEDRGESLSGKTPFGFETLKDNDKKANTDYFILENVMKDTKNQAEVSPAVDEDRGKSLSGKTPSEFKTREDNGNHANTDYFILENVMKDTKNQAEVSAAVDEDRGKSLSGKTPSGFETLEDNDKKANTDYFILENVMNDTKKNWLKSHLLGLRARQIKIVECKYSE